jgi:hypothetical protein
VRKWIEYYLSRIAITWRFWKYHGTYHPVYILDFIVFHREISEQERREIDRYLLGQKFMSRYHAGAKKTKPPKKKRREGITTRAQDC